MSSLPHDLQKRFLCLVVVLLSIGISPLWARTWKSANGYTCEADFVRFETSTKSVVIKRNSDGKELTIKIKDLSEADQSYLRQKWDEIKRLEAQAEFNDRKPASEPEVRPETVPQAEEEPAAPMPPQAVESDGAGSAIATVTGIGLLLIGVLAMVVGGIWLLVVAFKESIVWGLLCLFFSGIVPLIFVITHWDEAKTPFLVQLGGFGLCILAIVLM